MLHTKKNDCFFLIMFVKSKRNDFCTLRKRKRNSQNAKKSTAALFQNENHFVCTKKKFFTYTELLENKKNHYCIVKKCIRTQDSTKKINRNLCSVLRKKIYLS